MTSKRTLVVGAIIVDDLVSPSSILAARRTTPLSLHGRWEFPGGKVEEGEVPEDALRRELLEELGSHMILGEELVAPGRRPWRISPELEMRLWFAVPEGSEPEAGDSHDELAWLGREDLESVDWLDADRQVLTHLRLS